MGDGVSKRLLPLAHRLFKRDDRGHRAFALRQEVFKLRRLAASLAWDRLADGVGHGCGRTLNVRLKVQRAVLFTKGQPRLHFIETQTGFRLRDSFAADTREDEFVPEFVGGCKFFGALTSLMASTMAQASAG